MKKLLILFTGMLCSLPAMADGFCVLGSKQSREGWTISGCSQQGSNAAANQDGDLSRIIDDDVNTYWHSSWSVPHNDYNHFFVIDRGAESTAPVYGFGYTPRQDAFQGNGFVTECDVYVLDDISGLSTMSGEDAGVQSDAHSSLATFIADKTPAGHGSFNYTYDDSNNRAESKVAFSNPANGRYILFVATRTNGDTNNNAEKGNAFANCADFCTYDGVYIPCNQVFRMKMRATNTSNSYVYWNGTNPETKNATDQNAFVPERLWYLQNAGNGKVTLHTVAESGMMGMEFTTVTNVAAVLSHTPTELTPTVNVQTIHADNAGYAHTGFSFQIADQAYVNDAQNKLGVWNNAGAPTDGGSLVTFYALTDADIDGVTNATEDAKIAAKANHTPENIRALFDMTSILKEKLVALIAEANEKLENAFKDDLPGYHPVDGDLHDRLTAAVSTAEGFVDNTDASIEDIEAAMVNLRMMLLEVNNLYNGPFYGIYTINNADNRGYICYVENENNYAVSSGKGGYEIPGLDSDASRWAFVNVNGVQLLFNVASKKFLKPTGTGAGDSWLLLDEGYSPITIAQSAQGLGKVEINSIVGETIYHMSISNGYVAGVTGYYAANDGGVPFIFERVGDLSDELREEMENILITRMTNPDKVYTITNSDTANNRGSLIAVENTHPIYTTGKAGVDLDAANPNHQWSFVDINGQKYLYNIGAGKFANAYLEKRSGFGDANWAWQLSDAGTPVSVQYLATGNLNTFRIMGGENSNGNDVAGMMVINNNYAPVPNWSHDEDGNGFIFNLVPDAAHIDDTMIAKHTDATNPDALASLKVNTDIQNDDVVGSYTSDAVSTYLAAVVAAENETDIAKAHGMYVGAAHYLDIDPRVMPQDGLVYTIFDLTAEDFVRPSEDYDGGLQLGWLYTASDNGGTFTHTFANPQPAEPMQIRDALYFDNVLTLHNGNVGVKMAPAVGQVYLTQDDSEFGPYVITHTSDLSHITTGITEISAESGAENAVFDLQGRRVKANAKGLLIVNGKKAIVK